MKTVVVANPKGGSGKSTLAAHCAVAAELDGDGDGPAVIADTDPQGSAADWFNQRKKAGLDAPLYSPLTLSALRDRVAALAAAGAGYLFIDTAPSMGGVNAERRPWRLRRSAWCIRSGCMNASSMPRPSLMGARRSNSTPTASLVGKLPAYGLP